MGNFLRFLFLIIAILVSLSFAVETNLEMGFMKRLMFKCSRKLRSFEQTSGNMKMKTKLLAKAIPPTNLEGM